MRKSYSLLAWVAALLVIVPGLAPAQEDSEGAPKMVVPHKVMDVGTVPRGEIAEVAFEIVNEGSAPLEIRAVRPTCGCTVADYDKEIAPGETGAVRATLATRDFVGPIAKSILIMTNDPEEPTVNVVIKADVKPYVEVLPRPLVRFNAVQHEEMTESLVLAPHTGDDAFTITRVDSTIPFVETSWSKLEGEDAIDGKSGPQYKVALELSDDAPVGPVSGILTVYTDHPKAAEVPVKVYGVVRSLLHVTPTQIQFGSVDAKQGPGRNVIVVNNRSGDATINITGVSVDDEAFNAELSTIEEGRRYQVKVTVAPDAEAGAHDAVLTIRTDDADSPELKVPVRANVT